MTAREKKLSIMVGTVVALIVNYLLLEFFFTNESKLRTSYLRKTNELQTFQALLQEKESWEKRIAELEASQPVLTNEIRAPSALLDQIKEIALKQNITLEEPVLGAVMKRPYYTAVTTNFETKTTWEALCTFLRDIQAPNQFIVFDNVTIQVDSSDKTLHRAKFQGVAKWYAPK